MTMQHYTTTSVLSAEPDSRGRMAGGRNLKTFHNWKPQIKPPPLCSIHNHPHHTNCFPSVFDSLTPCPWCGELAGPAAKMVIRLLRDQHLHCQCWHFQTNPQNAMRRSRPSLPCFNKERGGNILRNISQGSTDVKGYKVIAMTVSCGASCSSLLQALGHLKAENSLQQGKAAEMQQQKDLLYFTNAYLIKDLNVPWTTMDFLTGHNWNNND